MGIEYDIGELQGKVCDIEEHIETLAEAVDVMQKLLIGDKKAVE